MNNVKEYINQYCEYVYGYSLPEDHSTYKRLKNIFDYLNECDIGFDLIQYVIEHSSISSELTFENLPEILWQNSLLQKGVFYYHNELRLIHSMPCIDIYTGIVEQGINSLEMKIKYTYEDVLQYYYRVSEKDIKLADQSRELGQIKFLYKKYLNYENHIHISAIDILLYTIDAMCNNAQENYDLFNTTRFEYETLIYLQTIAKQSTADKNNKIIWRQ